MRPRKPALFILGHDEAGMLRCARMQVPLRSSDLEIFDQVNDEQLPTGQYSGDACAGELVVPINAFSLNHTVFVKLERRGWFFDEAGWLELPAAVDSEPVDAETFAAEQPWVLTEKIDKIAALEQTS